tara:strand:- start:1138 stop:1551 length:414 start_codon:yes stop_codon:yes gene_type:complete
MTRQATAICKTLLPAFIIGVLSCADNRDKAQPNEKKVEVYDGQDPQSLPSKDNITKENFTSEAELLALSDLQTKKDLLKERIFELKGLIKSLEQEDLPEAEESREFFLEELAITEEELRDIDDTLITYRPYPEKYQQ